MTSVIIRCYAGRLVMLCLIFTMSACAKTKLVKTTSIDAQPASGWVEEPDIHDAQFTGNPELKPVHFEFDRYYLSAGDREILRQNAGVIQKNPEWEVLVEGHCDERGTSAYNLALGQKRAQVVRKYYLMLGIPGGRISTISYGEEKPVCQELTDECWSRNRRSEAKIKMPPAREVTGEDKGGHTTRARPVR